MSHVFTCAQAEAKRSNDRNRGRVAVRAWDKRTTPHAPENRALEFVNQSRDNY